MWRVWCVEGVVENVEWNGVCVCVEGYGREWGLSIG